MLISKLTNFLDENGLVKKVLYFGMERVYNKLPQWEKEFFLVVQLSRSLSIVLVLLIMF
jgi:hypothetical protein